jgi:hypothetical protein
MPDSTRYTWFVPSRHGDQAPDARLTNRTMNRIDVVLLVVVVVCMIWNVLGVREVTSGDGGMATLAGASDFFLRTSTIVLWSAVTIAVSWLIVRLAMTRETRFVLVWEGAILALAALMPVLTIEMAGFSLSDPSDELRLTAYECAGEPPPTGNMPNLADCRGYRLESDTILLAGEHPGSGDIAARIPTMISLNTATWSDLPGGTYAMYLLVDIPGRDCALDQPGVVAIDADLALECLDSGETVVRLTHPDDSTNLRLALYPDG